MSATSSASPVDTLKQGYFRGEHWSWVRCDRLLNPDSDHEFQLQSLLSPDPHDPSALETFADPDGAWVHLIIHFEHSAHALTEAALIELDGVLSDLERIDGAVGLMLWSVDRRHFVSGADVTSIAAIDNETDALVVVERAHRALTRLSQLRYPSVAVLRGTCLGGGLELALACSYRIVVDSSSTRVGLPEVNLGIIPGFGGTQRLPRLIGLRAGLGLMAAATRLPASAAYRRGIADTMIPEAGMVKTACEAAAKLVRHPRAVEKRRKKLKGGFISWVLERTPWGRSIVRRAAKKQIMAKTAGHYPAPFALLETVFDGWARPLEAGLALEAKAVSKLVPTSITKNLIRVFLASERAKKASDRVEGADPASLAPVASVGVVGAGVMGAGIAQIALEQGFATRIRDLSWDRVRPALERIGSHLEQRVKRKRLTPLERESILARLTYTTALQGFSNCDVVVEAAVEDLAIKRAIFSEVESCVDADTILATNTSALPITDIQEGAVHPARYVGLHFFNPVGRMPLVEVIPGRDTDPQVTARVARWVVEVGKYPVVVKDRAGFLVNRLLSPYLNAACQLLELGVPGPNIDRVARDFGLPMGPFRLLDEVGFDVAEEVASTLHHAFGVRFEPSGALAKLTGPEANPSPRLGRKTGLGFYRYGQGHGGGGGKVEWDVRVNALFPNPKLPNTKTLSDADILHALLDPLVDEAFRCLDEEIVEDADTLDLAMVMGTGFPPFRGGPVHWAESEGLARLVDRLEESSGRTGRVPGEGLKRRASDVATDAR